jgi:dTDP-glucose 4,6-dehydratase
MDKKKILFTGSCGFIVGNLLRKMVYDKEPYQLISLDRVSDQMANLLFWNKNHTFHVADIRDSHIIDAIFQFETPQMVIHGAAETINQKNFITSNVLGTQIIVDACLKHKVEKLIYLSADEVYGPAQPDQYFLETDHANPITDYAISKHAGELLIKAASLKHGLIYNIVRLSNGYGRLQGANNFIPGTIKSVLQNTGFSILGDERRLKTWTHVFDLCLGIQTVLRHGQDNQTYNVSSNQEFTQLEIAQKICNALGRGHNLINFGSEQFDHLNFECRINSEKIKKIGWESEQKLKDGVIETVEWYNKNQWFLK